MDIARGGTVDRWGGRRLRQADACRSDRCISEDRDWHCCGRRDNAVRAGGAVVAAQACVCLRGVLHGPQVITNRYDWKKDDDKHDQRSGGQTALQSRSALHAQPKTRADHGEQDPCEIEDKLHCLPRFYTNVGNGQEYCEGADGNERQLPRSRGTGQ
jgi:hypothetical protein